MHCMYMYLEMPIVNIYCGTLFHFPNHFYAFWINVKWINVIIFLKPIIEEISHFWWIPSLIYKFSNCFIHVLTFLNCLSPVLKVNYNFLCLKKINNNQYLKLHFSERLGPKYILWARVLKSVHKILNDLIFAFYLFNAIE